MRLLAILALLLSTAAISQQVKTVVYNGENYKEQYDIKISGDTVKHGPYKKYVEGKLHAMGTYMNDSKNHMWTFYYPNGKKQSEGLFASDEKVGLWGYYDQNGNVIQKYHHTKDTLEYFVWSNENESHFYKTESGDSVSTKLSSPPIYLGGNQLAVDAAYKEIKYPEEAKSKGITGMVYITFWVNKDGEATQHAIHKDLEGGCGQEALRAIKSIHQNWLPGTLNGQVVEAKYFFPIFFRLN